jgi:phosphomevalonate decarboxylase
LKVTVVAHPIQGLIKYHGLKNPAERLPYHDSISVCVEALTTTTTVEAFDRVGTDDVLINGEKPATKDWARVKVVLDELKRLAGFSGAFQVVSENSLRMGKGLGFSASGFAALGLAASKALGLDIGMVSLSEVVRLGAGSSTRSLAGGFAIWHANRNGRSYAEQLQAGNMGDFCMVIVPIASDVKTDEAHAEVLSSPLFKARLKNIGSLLEQMEEAIRKGDVDTVGRLAEEDTLNLHAITMTGKSRMVLWEPETVRIIKEVVKMREEGIPAWYSIDTGPSVFINTYRKYANTILERLRAIGFRSSLVSGAGGNPQVTGNHLF